MTEYYDFEEGKYKTVTTKISWDAWLELERRARDSRISMYQLARQILEVALVGSQREGRTDPPYEEKSIFPFLRWWWEHVAKEDPGRLDGAKTRAESLGMTFDHKLRLGLRILLDHGLL